MPSAVGVPDIVPPEYSVKPVGRLPLANPQVMGAAPVAASVSLYGVFIKPPGNVVVVITGAVAEDVIVIESALLSLPALFSAFTVKFELPATDGVPEITPAAESVTPVGKLPLCNDHAIGAVPVASSCAL